MTVMPYLEDLHSGDPPSEDEEELDLQDEADEDHIFNLRRQQEQPAGKQRYSQMAVGGHFQWSVSLSGRTCFGVMTSKFSKKN